MPIIREPLSISQFAELVGVEPARLIGVEFSRSKSTVVLCLEPDERQPRELAVSPPVVRRASAHDAERGDLSAVADTPISARVAGVDYDTGEIAMAQTSGTCSPLSGNTSIRKPKGKGKR